MTFYLVDNLVQGSPDWLAWRRGVIGASDAPTIMGENPWQSASYLAQEKLGLGRAFSGNEATREGQRLEPIARQVLSERLGISLNAAVIQDPEITYIAASLDALSIGNDVIVEIKCGAKAYASTAATGLVPSYYQAQLQHMLMVSGHESLMFAAFRPEQKLITLEVRRNPVYIDRLRRAEQSFMTQLVSQGHRPQQTFVGRHVP